MSDGLPPPPALPSARAHQLERAPVEPHAAAIHEAATSTSGFFQRLPPEVRRMILVEAFGDRIMHVNLQYRRAWPEAGPEVKAGVLPAIMGRMGTLFGGRVDQKKTRAWRWDGFVCHRNPKARGRHSRIGDNSVSEPYLHCLGRAEHRERVDCGRRSGEKPTSCRVGAMGWLRTCRQA